MGLNSYSVPSDAISGHTVSKLSGTVGHLAGVLRIAWGCGGKTLTHIGTGWFSMKRKWNQGPFCSEM